jgi:hypothetical protein
MVRLVNFKWLLGGSVAIYGIYFMMIARDSQAAKYTVGNKT